MKPERAAELRALMAHVQDCYLNDRPADRGERIRFVGGSHEYRLAGLAGTATQDEKAAMASWLRAAHRKLAREG